MGIRGLKSGARCLLLLWLSLPLAGQAQFGSTKVDGQVTITSYSGPGGAVIIPDQIDGLPVTSIGPSAFVGSGSVTNVSLGNSITNIGERAFAFTGLVSVTIPDSVVSIRYITFAGCRSLVSVTLGNRVTSIGIGAFADCPRLANITIPDSLQVIGDAAFSACLRLASVSHGTNITSIGVNAYQGSTALTNVTFGNRLASIGRGAFQGCVSLTHLLIPDSVALIGSGAFYDCASLRDISVEDNNAYYEDLDGVLFNRGRTLLLHYPVAREASAYVIPETVTRLDYGVFGGCARLVDVTMPRGLISIAEKSFNDCARLASITIPDSVTGITIGNEAFAYCGSLGSVSLGNSVTRLGAYNFYDCARLTNISLGTGLARIGFATFGACSNLVSVRIPARVNYLGGAAFGGGEALTAVYFEGNAPGLGSNRQEDGYTYLPGLAFDASFKVTSYYLPGTTGWSAMLGRSPTAIWSLPDPVILGNGTLGVRENRFGFTISWAAARPVVVDSAPNLLDPAWSPVATNSLAGGSAYFSDPRGVGEPARFYRVRTP